MRTTLTAAECIDRRCPAPGCLETRPRCPPGCPKARRAESTGAYSFKDIHASQPPGCVDSDVRYFRGARLRPPGTRPIPPKPPGVKRDRHATDAFLESFDCQETPWRSSVHASREFGGYQKMWKPSLAKVPTTGNVPVDKWTSTIQYKPDGHKCGKTDKWSSTIRYGADSHGHSQSRRWRPCVKCFSKQRDEEKPFRPQIAINGGPTYKSNKETSQNKFHPSLRYIPEYCPNQRGWKPHRAHVCSIQCPHQDSEMFAQHSYKHITDRTAQLESKELRAKNRLYAKEHPNYTLYHEPAHDDPPHHVPEVDFEGTLIPRSRKKPSPWTVRTNPMQPTEAHRGLRRHSNAGWMSHFESNPCACVCIERENFKPSIKILEGLRENLSVQDRNPMTGMVTPKDMVPPRRRLLGPKNLAPFGNYNQDVLDGRFQNHKMESEPMTEQRAQYTTCKPWVREEIFQTTSQAYKENRTHELSVHPSINRFLYEDKDAVVG